MKRKIDSDPSKASLRAIPEVDFRRYGPGKRNPFAKRIRAEGCTLAHHEPAPSSLRDMPEIDSTTKGSRNPYAQRIRAGGIELQVGRGRPPHGHATGPTHVKSIRLPPSVWRQLERRARAHGMTLHALLRMALLEWLDQDDRSSSSG